MEPSIDAGTKGLLGALGGAELRAYCLVWMLGTPEDQEKEGPAQVPKRRERERGNR
jgi:hypothetical protein